MPASARKRPWYLILALLGALAFGAKDLSDGWAIMAYYREPLELGNLGAGVTNEADRAAVVSREKALVQALDAAKGRGWPLGVATLLIGGAVFVVAFRALGGSRGARIALVQLVVAQALVNAAGLFVLRDVSDAELRVFEARQAIELHEKYAEQPAERAMAADLVHKVLPILPPILLGLRSIAAALIALSLLQRGSREYFEGPAEAAEER
jgi:hypothetical protein